MKSFDEYFSENFEDGLSSPSKYIIRHTFEAGQQSKQAEVDELQKRIDEALNKSEDFYDFGDGESATAFCNEVINVLKGDQS